MQYLFGSLMVPLSALAGLELFVQTACLVSLLFGAMRLVELIEAPRTGDVLVGEH